MPRGFPMELDKIILNIFMGEQRVKNGQDNVEEE